MFATTSASSRPSVTPRESPGKSISGGIHETRVLQGCAYLKEGGGKSLLRLGAVTARRASLRSRALGCQYPLDNEPVRAYISRVACSDARSRRSLRWARVGRGCDA